MFHVAVGRRAFPARETAVVSLTTHDTLSWGFLEAANRTVSYQLSLHFIELG